MKSSNGKTAVWIALITALQLIAVAYISEKRANKIEEKIVIASNKNEKATNDLHKEINSNLAKYIAAQVAEALAKERLDVMTKRAKK